MCGSLTRAKTRTDGKNWKLARGGRVLLTPGEGAVEGPAEVVGLGGLHGLLKSLSNHVTTLFAFICTVVFL